MIAKMGPRLQTLTRSKIFVTAAEADDQDAGETRQPRLIRSGWKLLRASGSRWMPPKIAASRSA
jgi:hypothetical protein